MPELPEVETVRRGLESLVVNKIIIKIEVFYDKILQNITSEEFNKTISLKKIVEIKRRGKYLIFVLSDDYYLVSHLRMEGKYYLRGLEKKEKHEHIIFYLDSGETLRYNDTRKFGVMYLFKCNSFDELLKIKPFSNLGFEPGEKELTSLYLKSKLKEKKTPIKTLLLDQSIILGLGNIYADEVLYLSKINPLKEGYKINEDEIIDIIKNSKIVIDKAIMLGGTTIKSFKSSHEISGLFQNELLVHTKKICPKCSGEIKKIYISSRGTYYCPNCQI